MRTSMTFAALPLALLFAGCQTPPRGADSTTPTAEAPGGSPAPGPGNITRPDSTAPGAGPVMIALDKTSYAAGGEVSMKITSHATDTLGFNPCTRSIERRAGGRWSTVPDEGRMCTMELWILKPHETRDAKTELPTPLAAGEYRIVILFSAQKPTPSGTTPGIRGESAPFQVR
jgi:hypothetical protein